MANLKSSKKDVRRIEKKTAVNKSVRTSLKTYVKRVRQAVESGDAEAIQAAVNLAAKNIDKASQRGIIHKNQAARRKSRVMQAVQKAGVVAEAPKPAKKAKATKAKSE